MKDAFGGAYMIYVFIGFVAIFIIFISLILKYGQAFKVKNEIINIIEEYEGSIVSASTSEEIAKYIDNSTYRPQLRVEDYKPYNGVCNSEYAYCYVAHDSKKGTYYTVYTFIDWNFPFFNISGVWTIKGETRLLAAI